MKPLIIAVAGAVAGVIAAPSVSLADSSARFQDVEAFDGTFVGTNESEVDPDPAKLKGEWAVGSGEIHLTRVAPRWPGDARWEGTAEASQTIKFTMDSPFASAVIKGNGHSKGTAKMKLTPAGYQIEVKLPDVPATQTSTTPQGTTSRPTKAGIGHVYMNGTLPDKGYDLNGTEPRSVGAGHQVTFTWKMKGKPPEDLVAVPKIAPVVRGAKSHLDGTGSRKKERIESYKWTLEPSGECPSGAPSGSFDGAEVDVLLLCSMKATLVVSDGEKESDPVTVEATVRKREWKTELVKPRPVGPDKIPALGLVTNQMLFGEAICAEEGSEADAAGHVIHRTDNLTWRGATYEIEAVSDPKSPFDGWFWVSENKSKYSRRIRINRELYPGSTKPDGSTTGSTTGQANAKNPAYAKDLALILRCTERHEREHDTQISKKLAGDWDPVKKIEKLIGKNETTLATDVDSEFAKAEERFAAVNFFEVAVQAAIANGGCEKPATILIKTPEGDFKPKTFPKVSSIGDKSR